MKNAVKLFALLMLALIACSRDPDGPEKKQNIVNAPLVMAYPQPGVYETDRLSITISTPEPGVELWYDFNVAPIPAGTSYGQRFELELKRSSRILVVAVDEAGREWGPFTFEYGLKLPSDSNAACTIGVDRSMVNGGEKVWATVQYTAGTQIDRFVFTVNGNPLNVDAEPGLHAFERVFELGPWPEGGTQELECRVDGPQPAVGLAIVIVDTIPPTLEFFEVPAFTVMRNSWPNDFVVHAFDEGSGLEDVRICSLENCVAMQGVGGGRFEYVTAFTAQTMIDASLMLKARDKVGNESQLGPIAYRVQLAEPEVLPIAPTAMTMDSEISLADFLLAPRPITHVVRLGEPEQVFNSASVPLLAGWNDFLFLQDGKTEWESFSIYRMGFRAILPESGFDWLVYHSASTIPAFQATGFANVQEFPFERPWWEIPHLWFVVDKDNDGRWSAADDVCIPSADDFAGPWSFVAEPWEWSVSLEECRPSSYVTPMISRTIVCEDCNADGRLFVELREGETLWPLYHSAVTDISAAAMTEGVQAMFPLGQPDQTCLYYWNESGTGAIVGDEPRAWTSCSVDVINLSRSGSTFTARISGKKIVLEGLSPGAEGHFLLEAGNETPALRRSLGQIEDRDGLGIIEIDWPEEIPLELPWRIRFIESDGREATADLVYPLSPTSHTLELSVVDDWGEPVTYETTVIMASGNRALGFLHDGAKASNLYQVPEGEEPVSGIALREGLLSVHGFIGQGATAATLRILGPEDSGFIEGKVLDRDAEPVAYAKVSWAAGQYYAETLADASGNYKIPALGNGSLQVEGAFLEQVGWQQVDIYIGEVEHRDFVLPAKSTNTARGLLKQESSVWVTGEGLTVDIIQHPPFYSAALTHGTWTQTDGTVRREFRIPGFLPAYDPPSQQVATLPAIGAAGKQYLACGARRQAVSGPQVMVDAPCWQWFAETAFERYYLGFVNVGEPVPELLRFGTIEIEVPHGFTGVLILTDVLLGRKIRLPVWGAIATDEIPLGEYWVTSENGDVFHNESGSPARVQVFPGLFGSTYKLYSAH